MWRCLVNFTKPSAAGGLHFVSVDDRVMGGVSRSNFTLDAQGGCFSGTVTTESNGGFCSCTAETNLDLEGASWIRVTTAKADKPGLYKLSLRDPYAREKQISWQTEFIAGDESGSHELPLADFTPRRRGRAVHDCPPLDLKNIVSVGFMLSVIRSDINQPGPFALWIAKICAK